MKDMPEMVYIKLKKRGMEEICKIMINNNVTIL